MTKLDQDVEVSIVTDARARTVAQNNGVEQAAVGEVVKINGKSRDTALTVGDPDRGPVRPGRVPVHAADPGAGDRLGAVSAPRPPARR